MVKLNFRWLTAGAFLLALAAAAKDLGDYRIGDAAESDIFAPFPLTVPDEAATRLMKQREAERVPVHLYFYTNSAEEVVASFHTAFVDTRSNFLYAAETVFGQGHLNAQSLASPRFQSFVISFQIQNTLFPVDTRLAELWASGQSDQAFEKSIVSKLHAAMSHPVRSPDALPPDIKIGSTARLIPLADTNQNPTPKMAELLGFNLPKTNLISYQRTKTELQNAFPPEEHAIGRYAAQFIRPNCLLAADLTRQLRAARTDPILAVERYEPGQIIARRGDLIDPKIKAALNQIRDRIALGQLQQRLQEAQSQAAERTYQIRWLTAGLLALVLLLILAIWRITRRKPQSSQLPIPVVNRIATPSHQEALRAGLISQLASVVSSRFVQRLISQRAQLLESNEKAAAEMEKLGERLETIHSRMQDRMTAYEQRIVELERELETKDEQHRELIKAEILAIRRQLEIERQNQEVNFN